MGRQEQEVVVEVRTVDVFALVEVLEGSSVSELK